MTAESLIIIMGEKNWYVTCAVWSNTTSRNHMCIVFFVLSVFSIEMYFWMTYSFKKTFKNINWYVTCAVWSNKTSRNHICIVLFVLQRSQLKYFFFQITYLFYKYDSFCKVIKGFFKDDFRLFDYYHGSKKPGIEPVVWFNTTSWDHIWVVFSTFSIWM